MRLLRPAALAALATASLLAQPAGAMDFKEFQKKFQNTPNSWERRALVQQLDPKDKNALKALLQILVHPAFDWYIREGVIEVLQGAIDPGVVAQLEKIKPEKDALAAEGIAMAFGRSGNKERVPYLLDCLKSKKWVARRAAAISLRHMPDKRVIQPLIEAWEREEKDGGGKFVVWVQILETLEALTRQKDLDTPQKWKDWWLANKDTFEFPSGDGKDELKEEDKSGELIKTKVRGTNLTLRSRGQGLPLLVLPDYGYENQYLETYLRNLEDTNRIYYATLPGVIDFTDPPLTAPAGLPQPYYPLERIAQAFEGFQQELVKSGKLKKDEKFAILAHGISCWIAMKFAEKYPREVRRLVLIAAHSGEKAASEGITNLIKTGQRTFDVEMEHYGQSRSFEGGKYKYEAKGQEDSQALSRKSFSVRFGDRRNLEIGLLYGPLGGVEKKVGENQRAIAPKFARPMGGCFIPKFSLFSLQRTGTPTLVMWGKGSIESAADDAQAIAKFYGEGGRVVVFNGSGDMPFIEENEKFVEVVRKWLGGKKQPKPKGK